MALFSCERDRWTFTLMGTDATPPPDTREGMLESIKGLAPRWVVDAVAAAEPLGPVAVHHFPASVRRRYDRLARFPRGLLVFGDAICSFNPIYGQGMSVAAEQAVALRGQLAEGSDHDLAARFFSASARPIGTAWRLAVGSDLAIPGVEGPRPLAMRLSNVYVGLVLGAAEKDPEVARRFMRVAGLVDEPPALFSPAFVGRVLRSWVRRTPRPATVTPVVTPVSAG
jgi:2-polyprenyl-6-methoxyphenol hydroxylase-like FAD-dependent oxidoreductase